MRILVTGGSGFIGRHLVAALKARGDEVATFDITTGADVCYFPLGNWPEVIYHLAAITSIPKSYINPVETIRVNVGGTLNIVRQSMCPVVLASTSNEGTSPYTVSKRAAELCMRPGDSIIKLTNVYGPGGHGAVDIFKQADVIQVHGGRQVKDFVHVDDVVQAFLNFKPGTTCCCSQRLISVHDLACMFPAKEIVWLPEQEGDLSQRPLKSDYPITRRLEDYVKA